MSSPFVGDIMIWPTGWAPKDWAICDGQLLATADYAELFALIGNIYGGNGRTDFGLPDLRGRSPLGVGNGYYLGYPGGFDNLPAMYDTLPQHCHEVTYEFDLTIPATYSAAVTDVPSSAVCLATGASKSSAPAPRIYSPETPDTTLGGAELSGTITCNYAGQSASLYRRQPCLALNYIIALKGLFPSRN